MSTKIETNVTMGESYKDKVTGFVGKAVAVTKWQFGCIRVALRPVVNKDGEMKEEEWFDEESLKGVEIQNKTSGGPSNRPKMNRDPKS